MSTERQRGKVAGAAAAAAAPSVNPSSRPLMPRLAATTTQNRATPPPKLAARFTPSNASSTPRRPPLLAANTNASNGRRQADHASTPLKNLSNHVTPRSGTRQSRPSSSSSTPTGTVTNHSEVRRMAQLQAPGGTTNLRRTSIGGSTTGGFDMRNFITAGISTSPPALRPPQPSPKLTMAQPNSGGSASTGNTAFFHANETPTARPTPQRPPMRKKSSSFIYANDARDFDQPSMNVLGEPDKIANAAAETPLLDATSLSMPVARTAPTSPSGSLSLGTGLSPQPTTFLFQTLSPQFLRSPSPSKDNIHLSYRKGASQIIRPASQATSRGALPISEEDGSLRQVSLDLRDDSQPQMHAPDSADVQPATSPHQAVDPDLESFVTRKTDNYPLGSPIRHARGNSVPHLGSFPQSPPGIDDSRRSPTTSATGEGNSKYFSDLAANARRERKVLDLQISNSSLLAINKTLEREVRRQKLELRRLRRQSRHRQTSFGSDSLAFANSDRLADLPEQEQDNSDGIDELSNLSDEEDSVDEDLMSPTEIAALDERHRIKDERRLQLDLTKHKELLLDSQKLNQSLKRCLGMTDHLISEAGKALQYKVNVNDIELGGRVLSLDEDFSELHEGDEKYAYVNVFDGPEEHYIESTSQPGRAGFTLESGRGWVDTDPGDRDSGVDMEESRRQDMCRLGPVGQQMHTAGPSP